MSYIGLARVNNINAISGKHGKPFDLSFPMGRTVKFLWLGYLPQSP